MNIQVENDDSPLSSIDMAFPAVTMRVYLRADRLGLRQK